jgi:hypothetical protein
MLYFLIMSRRITGFEFEAAKSVRDQAREDMGILCPRAVVALSFLRSTDEVGVQAQVQGDITPYSKEDVIAYLSDIGLQKVVVVELEN